MTMYGAAVGVAEVEDLDDVGWRMALAARASVKKRADRVGSPARFGWRTLIADLRAMVGCSARYTLPMPPSPRRDLTW